jgi:hypothetical protein
MSERSASASCGPRRSTHLAVSHRLELDDPLRLLAVGEGEERDLVLAGEQLTEQGDELF